MIPLIFAQKACMDISRLQLDLFTTFAPSLAFFFFILAPLFYLESQLVLPEIAGADLCV